VEGPTSAVATREIRVAEEGFEPTTQGLSGSWRHDQGDLGILLAFLGHSCPVLTNQSLAVP
jgi:hypothetical protein